MRTRDGNIVKMSPAQRAKASEHQAMMSYVIDAGLNSIPAVGSYYWYLTHQNDDQNAK